MAEKQTVTREERRANREARREKQRALNATRALKMHKARLGWESPPRSVVVTEKTAGATEVHVGCSGWFYWHWRGAFYPAQLPTGRWFEHYARRFKTVAEARRKFTRPHRPQFAPRPRRRPEF